MSTAKAASRSIVLFLAVFASAACSKKASPASGSSNGTPAPASTRIDDESTAPLVFDDGKRALLPQQEEWAGKGPWMPKRFDAERASDGIPALLATKGPKGAKVAAKLAPYYGQIWGVTNPQGTKVIHLSFMCRNELELFDAGAAWTQQAIMVNDGGDCFFQVDFDPATSTYSSFMINGDA